MIVIVRDEPANEKIYKGQSGTNTDTQTHSGFVIFLSCFLRKVVGI